MAFATFEQFQTRFERTLASAQEPRVTALLEDASAIMSGRVPQLLDADPVPQIAVSVCCAMVARVVRNPEGKFREDYGGDYEFQRDASQASGELELTENEYDDLVAAVSGAAAAGRSFSIAPLYPAVGEV
ncbi:hypothetical protein HD597_010085 [Nonomuraea thailandensis]|uniref:Uncharacterized protein n=1 Tax=Nonomuraea thailandensis TaxID=1188745 RepID=A0A9X2GSD0_9ACTN|nr:Gp19/Gp15/Gp42 family protein [Nonomuraea thailandensis]MCP2363065.1 hypothetical protein [Nonomuraea thailandensis]